MKYIHSDEITMKYKVIVMEHLLVITLVAEIAGITEDATVNLCGSGPVPYHNYTVSTTELCGCDRAPTCVRKCCRNGFFHYHHENLETGLYVSVCIRNDTANFTVPIYDDVTKQYDLKDGFMVGMLSCNNTGWYQYFKMDNTDPRQKFFVQKDGTLYYPFYEKIYSNNRYCVDERDGLTAYVCLTPPDSMHYVEKVIHVSAKLVPIPFLLVTFLVYAALPESNLHSKALMFHVMALIFGYMFLAVAQYYVVEDDRLCQALGFSIIFFMLASFFWMNVMCIDIWCAFSGLQGFYSQKKMERKLLALFCLYAWGVPGLFVFILVLLNTYGDKNGSYHPGVGSPLCFLTGNLPTLLYYFGPILALIIVNIVLFILTAINIQKVRKETSMLRESESQRHYSKDDEKYRLYWKLLFAMGINPVINTHVIQTISWVVGWKLSEDTAKYIWFIKDFAHTMYGIVIFIIFVCKKKIWILLKKRYYKPGRNSSTADSTPPTTVSGLTPTENIAGYCLNDLTSEKEEKVDSASSK